MITCKNCGTENMPGTLVCTSCNTMLTDGSKPDIATTRTLQDVQYSEGEPKWGSARISEYIILDVLDSDQKFIFDTETLDRIELGRLDPDTGQNPDVELTPSGAAEKGVSRHHAFITRREKNIHLIDNKSANGTYLNGQRLVAKQPRIVRDGDDIRLGHLVLRVSFRKLETQLVDSNRPDQTFGNDLS